MNLIPDDADELLQRIDQPLTEKADPDTVSSNDIPKSCFRRRHNHNLFHLNTFRAVDIFSVITTEMETPIDRPGLTSTSLP